MKYWLAVASSNHVALGVAGGFMQVCHGKQAPLKRIQPDDGVIYYSPSRIYGQADGLKSFTAVGFVAAGEVYQADMGNGFLPFRRDVHWAGHGELPITPLLQQLELTAGKKNWGYPLRFGLLPLAEADFQLIYQLMTQSQPA